MESQGQFDFDPEMFDFCIHRRKSKSSMARLAAKIETPGELPKKIKTLLPKTKALPATPENTLLLTPSPAEVASPMTPITTPVEEGGKEYQSPSNGTSKNNLSISLFVHCNLKN